jgi:iron complex transport system permease protein
LRISLPAVRSGVDKKRVRIVVIALIVLMVMLVLVALSVGQYSIPLADVVKILVSRIIPVEQTWPDLMESVIFSIRLPRIIAALLIGAALSEAGTAYQGLFKNPMVSPDLLGVSAGACVGAAFAILVGWNLFGVQICAFVCGIVAVAIATAIPRLLRNRSILMLVLSGVVVGGFMNAILGIFKYVADVDTQLADIVYWIMGSLNSVHMIDILYCGPVMLAAGIALMLLRWRLNVIALGEHEAYYLGINVSRMRGLIIVSSTLLTASAVCLSGTINWIGLVIPHMGRLLVGKDNRHLMPVAILLGACFMLLIDTVARTFTATEIPLSILTGLFGAPLFVWFLTMQKKGVRE